MSVKNLTIAVIDDDKDLGSLIGDYLTSNGFLIALFETGEAFLESDLSRINLAILDVGLPGIDGFAVCKQLRERSQMPIIMLTAASDDIDRILGLELGADDYMGKPFNPRELLARIKAALRRTEPLVAQEGGLVIRERERQVTWKGRLIDLTGAEFDLLLFLNNSAGEVVTRDEISIKLKGHAASPFDRSIDTLVSRLRKKIKSIASVDLIRSVRGKGYVLAP
ncbi:MAG: response regulator transcription factor [Litorivicinaceae bacterium]|jgi:two-component system OmpR family response regulator